MKGTDRTTGGNREREKKKRGDTEVAAAAEAKK